MRVFATNKNDIRPLALTIGNFDGIHRGHQRMLSRLVEVAKEKDLVPSIMTFNPHPSEFFSATGVSERLFGTRDKVLACLERGVERVHILPFNNKYAAMSAESFIQDVLVRRLGVRWIIVGDDFRFGASRRGDFKMLQSFGSKFRFEVESMPSFEVNGVRVSSTLVRDALRSGNLALAQDFLGRRYNVCGRVVHGDQVGRTLGYPTANIHRKQTTFPLSGVFTALVDGVDLIAKHALVSVGTRPTIVDKGEVRIEAHLLDFSGDLYGKKIRVTFLEYLRGQVRFSEREQLIMAMQEDERTARQYFLNFSSRIA